MDAFFNQLLALDGQILLFIQAHLRFDVITPIAQGLSKIGDNGAVWIILGILLLFPKKTRRTGILVILALAIDFCIVNLWMKDFVGRIRPYEVIDGLKCLVPAQHDASFPSGHSAAAFAAAMVVFKNRPKRLGVPCIVLAALIALSRLYVGVHYPTDVICGAIIGALIGLVVFWIFGDKHYKRKAKKSRK